MEIQALQALYTRELIKLRDEIAAYSDEEKLWVIEKNIANSGGNLCLHLIGNLNTYIGNVYGNGNYVRNRPLEFSAKGISKASLIRQVEDTLSVVSRALTTIDDPILSDVYPVLIFEEKKSVRYTLIHLAMLLTYHLGQINYHRRLLDGPAKKRRTERPIAIVVW